MELNDLIKEKIEMLEMIYRDCDPERFTNHEVKIKFEGMQTGLKKGILALEGILNASK